MTTQKNCTPSADELWTLVQEQRERIDSLETALLSISREDHGVSSNQVQVTNGPTEKKMSRAGLLRVAGAGAVAVIAAGAATGSSLGGNSSVADAAGPVLLDTTNIGTATTVIQSRGTTHTAFWGQALPGSTNGVHGSSYSDNASGVWGENLGGGNGVAGTSVSGEGVLGHGQTGVHGKSSSSDSGGVWGENNAPLNPRHPGDGPGVLGTSTLGEGVFGHAVLPGGTNGVHGQTSNDYASGVWGENNGKGTGVAGDAYGTTGTGVTGIAHNRGIGVAGSAGRVIPGHGVIPGTGVSGVGTSIGVSGEGTMAANNKSAIGGSGGVFKGITIGVSGDGTMPIGSDKDIGGRGGVFKGTVAQIQLIPSDKRVGRPKTGHHLQGDVWLDAAGDIYVCTASGYGGGVCFDKSATSESLIQPQTEHRLDRQPGFA